MKETIDAKKQRYGAGELDDVLGTATKVVAARGKKVLEFALKDADRAALEKAVIGPSGNLRAPTAKVGRTVLVGFNEDMWGGVLG